jgi:hypothetical protein
MRGQGRQAGRPRLHARRLTALGKREAQQGVASPRRVCRYKAQQVGCIHLLGFTVQQAILQAQARRADEC